MTELSSELLANAVRPLILWYDTAKKPLPWRQSPTPYHVWISEVMLQQTRTAAVIPYYERFLTAVPSPAALAGLDEGVLMKLWEGLGYYSRARNLQKAAKKLMSDFGGVFPRTAAELVTLPGIGDYTAGAIASIAFGEPEPAVDGNVLRVVMRFCACADDISLPATKKAVTKALSAVYPRGEDAGKLTQAIMELGENVCIPNGAPHCLDCPLAECCRGLSAGIMRELPVKSPKKGRRTEERTVLLLRCGDRYAIRKRPERGLLAGLWEYPSVPGRLTGEETAGVVRMLGIEPLDCRPLGDAVHIFTHIEWHMTGYLWDCDRLPTDFVFATVAEITGQYAVPKAFRAYTEKLLSIENLK